MQKWRMQDWSWGSDEYLGLNQCPTEIFGVNFSEMGTHDFNCKNWVCPKRKENTREPTKNLGQGGSLAPEAPWKKTKPSAEISICLTQDGYCLFFGKNMFTHKITHSSTGMNVAVTTPNAKKCHEQGGEKWPARRSKIFFVLHFDTAKSLFVKECAIKSVSSAL